MSVQLLDKTRKINKLLHNNNSSKVVFNDICEVLTEILDSNVLVVSKKGKVVAKKKGVAMITVKVKGSKTLRCKVTVKDNRKPVTKKPAPAPSPNPAPKPDGECEHDWVEKTVYEIVCSCGETFPDDTAWALHNRQFILQGLEGHSSCPNEQTYYECSKCHKTK